MDDNERAEELAAKIFLSMLLISMLLIISMPFIHFPNDGSHVGYVTAIDVRVTCAYIYYKTDLASSQEDTYCIPKNSEQISRLREAISNKENIEIFYKAHTFGLCDREIYEVKSIDNI